MSGCGDFFTGSFAGYAVNALVWAPAFGGLELKRGGPPIEHDLEKWLPVFGKDLAPPIMWSGMRNRR
jgi:hypothetical protein